MIMLSIEWKFTILVSEYWCSFSCLSVIHHPLLSSDNTHANNIIWCNFCPARLAFFSPPTMTEFIWYPSYNIHKPNLASIAGKVLSNSIYDINISSHTIRRWCVQCIFDTSMFRCVVLCVYRVFLSGKLCKYSSSCFMYMAILIIMTTTRGENP